MSGGLDSSVAASLLLDQGYRVEGWTMRLWREPECGYRIADDVLKARAVCKHLNIAHHVIDLREEFRRDVVGYFLREYAHGHTPNPCIRCNSTLKFGLLLDRARKSHYDYLATGHYARIECVDGDYRLLRARDLTKDQSYVLYTLQQEHLRRVLFPLGGLTKRQVRALATRRGLPVADRSESQDICFICDGDYRRFIREYSPVAVRAGPILNTEGQRLGEHKGLPFYTVGQREGLGIAAARPLYVIELDADRNALIVGFAHQLGRSTLDAEHMSYVSGRAPAQGVEVAAKIRYRASRTPATLWGLPGRRAHLVLERPLRDATPGQAVVLYRGEEVLGGGTIVDSRKSAHSARRGGLCPCSIHHSTF